MKVETIAKGIHNEIGQEIECIHPWQYQHLNLISINYDVILEDIETYWNQEARFREGFKIENNNIYVPNFFTKVNGIHKNKKDYITFIQSLKESKNTIVLDKCFYFENKLEEVNTNTNESENLLVTKEDYLNFLKEKDDEISEIFYYPISVKNILKHNFLGYIIKDNYYTFDNLTSSKQKQLIQIINKFIETKKDEWSKKEFDKFFSICFSLPDNIISLINNFDYSFDVPKIIFIGNFINSDTSILLSLLNEFAIDILLLEPSGKSTIEKYMDINELSLGYFIEDFNTKEALISNKEKKIIQEEKKKQAKINTINKVNNFFNSYGMDILLNVNNYILVLCCFIFAFKISSGWFNSLFELISCGILGLINFYMLEKTNNWMKVYNDNFYRINTYICIMVIIFLFIGRGTIWLINIEDTHTHNGYVQIEEDIELGKDNYVMKYKKDAIGYENSSTIYCYIENNNENTETIYIKLYVGNTEVYCSGKIKPLTYIPRVNIKNFKLPIGDNIIKIQYYLYDTKINEKTDTLLGEGTINCHIYEDTKSYENARKTYNLDYCN